MRILVLTWRDPTNSLQSERFLADNFKVHTEQGWLKLNDKDGIARIIPSERVCLVQFAEEPDEPRILKPGTMAMSKLPS